MKLTLPKFKINLTLTLFSYYTCNIRYQNTPKVLNNLMNLCLQILLTQNALAFVCASHPTPHPPGKKITPYLLFFKLQVWSSALLYPFSPGGKYLVLSLKKTEEKTKISVCFKHMFYKLLSCPFTLKHRLLADIM